MAITGGIWIRYTRRAFLVVGLAIIGIVLVIIHAIAIAWGVKYIVRG